MEMFRIIGFLSIVFTLAQNIRGDLEKLHLVKSWKSLDFLFPNANARQQAIESGEFIPGRIIPLDFALIPNQTHRMGKMLITIPRFQRGVPVTLGYVTEKVSKENNLLIAPYPNWEMNKLDNNCDHMISVFRITTDECNRLWVLDNGMSMDDRICPPKLLIFNVTNDELTSIYEFPSNQFYNDSIFLLPIVDIRFAKCDKAFAYIADVSRHQLIVYDHENKRSWNIQNPLFNNEKAHLNFTINNQSFTSHDGIFAMTQSPLIFGEKLLYFHSLASLSENYVPTSVIRNFELFRGNPNASSQSFQQFPYKRPSQSSSEIMDRRGILFYPLLSQTALACWNSRTQREFNENSVEIVARNAETLQFPSSMKILSQRGKRDQLWLMTICYQKFILGTLNPNETNFRIQYGYVDDLIRGTNCDTNLHRNHQYGNKRQKFRLSNETKSKESILLS